MGSGRAKGLGELSSFIGHCLSPSRGACVLPLLSLPRLRGLCHCFLSHDGDHLPHDLQLLVAEPLVGAGLRGKCHGGSGVCFCGLVWRGAASYSSGPMRVRVRVVEPRDKPRACYCQVHKWKSSREDLREPERRGAPSQLRPPAFTE